MKNNDETIFYAGIYIRLSQEDKDKKYDTDSESVANQRDVLKQHCKNNGFVLVEEYVDDGYSGTTFDRPAFIKMIDDIQRKKINTVIVKDLSRLGRDHVMTGYYLEVFFPENQVRFISMLESYDSIKVQASNDASTFIIACNDYYSKQNSLKIRNILDNKRREGKFIGSKPSYGYKRDPYDKGHLIVDPITAPYVQKMFELRVRKTGLSAIATYMNEIGAPTPSKYKGTAYSSRLLDNERWTISTVRKILQNRMYTGDMVQHTQEKINYKSKKKVTLSQKQWLIVENTHEAIIDKALFYKVNGLKKGTSRLSIRPIERERKLIEGLLFCKECGNRLSVTYHANNDYWGINCNRYARDPIRKRCSSHFYPYIKFEQVIVNELKKQFDESISALDIDKLNEIIKTQMRNPKKGIRDNIGALLSEKEKIERKMQVVYEDRLNNLITIEQYQILSKPYEQKMADLKKIISNTRREKEPITSESYEQDYKNKIKELLNIETNRGLINCIVEKIESDVNRNITIKYVEDLFNESKFNYVDKLLK